MNELAFSDEGKHSHTLKQRIIWRCSLLLGNLTAKQRDSQMSLGLVRHSVYLRGRISSIKYLVYLLLKK